jgi:(p)ppGpp synthase/HD superfamily hydrolase
MEDIHNTQLEKAIAIAATAFQGKLDKGGQPYILHCLRVMNGVNQSDKEIMQMAVLHDLVEDCPDWTVQRLHEEGFSHKVCSVIELLTHNKIEDYTEYISRISTNPHATEIKLADLRDNTTITRLKDLRPQDFERLKKYHRAYRQLISA